MLTNLDQTMFSSMSLTGDPIVGVSDRDVVERVITMWWSEQVDGSNRVDWIRLVVSMETSHNDDA